MRGPGASRTATTNERAFANIIPAARQPPCRPAQTTYGYCIALVLSVVLPRLHTELQFSIMPPKLSRKLAPTQIDLIWELMVKHKPIAGSDDAVMSKKSIVVWQPMLKELEECMPDVIAALDPKTPYKSLDTINESTLKTLWEGWTKSYRETKSACNVSSHFKRGQTGLSGADALLCSMTDALINAEAKCAMFPRYHEEFGACARFVDQPDPAEPRSCSSRSTRRSQRCCQETSQAR